MMQELNHRNKMEDKDLILQKLAEISSQLNDLKSARVNVPQPAKSDALNELSAALAKAQAEMMVAGMNAENPYFKVKYADLAAIIKASRPALTKHNLAVIQQLLPNDDGQNILHTILLHASGQWIESRMRVVPPKNDIQTLGSYITYLKRYAYASLIGVVSSHEDDDGEVAMVEARQIIAKGPSTKYNPKQESYDTISKDQLDELEYELQEYPDLADEIMDKMRLQSLADMPKSKYMVSLQRIREIKQMRNHGK